jgi:uncharacterized protein (UPF0332 family)
LNEIEECFRKNQIVKSAAGKSEIDNSLLLAEQLIVKAKKILKAGVPDIAFTTAYTAMFHTARALLFSKGLKERSHYCLIAFLQKEYIGTELHNFLNILDNYRQIRNNTQYDGSLVPSADAKNAIIDAEDFLKTTEKELVKTSKY